MAKIGNFNLEDSKLIEEAQKQSAATKTLIESILPLLNNTTIPKNNWNTQLQEGDPGRFANPNMSQFGKPNVWQEMDAHSKKLIAGEKGFQAQKAILRAPYTIIEKLMQHGYSPGTNDVQGVDNAAAISTALMGTGAAAGGVRSLDELAAFKGSLKSTKPSYWTQDKVDRLKAIDKRLEGQPTKKVLSEFRAQHPDYSSGDDALKTMLYRTRNWSGLNKETGVAAAPNPSIGAPGSAGGAFAKQPGKFQWTPEAENHLIGLNQNYPKGAMGRNRIIEEEFKKQYPNYTGRYSDLSKMIYKFEEGGGGTTLGSNFGNKPPGGPPNPRLNTESPGVGMGWLQENQPVTPKWLEEWAKDANVPINKIREANTGTKYINLKNPHGGPEVIVRMPTDEGRHIATQVRPNEIGRFFDTGTGHYFPGKGNEIFNRPESSLINQGGVSYAQPQALEDALTLATSSARYGKNWLRSPDAAPRLPNKPTVVDAPIPPDPRQLKLLSGGYTPADIINILRQQNGSTQ